MLWQVRAVMRSLLRRSDFSRHVFTLVTGAVLAQVIPLATAPILTRLYSPEAFGIYSMLVAFAAILSVAATARYELAIMLPKDEGDGQAVAVFSLGLACLVCSAAFVVFLLFGDAVARLTGNEKVGVWLLAVPPLVLMMSAGQVLNYWANRNQRYKLLATNAVTFQGAFAGLAISGVFGRAAAAGLIISRCVAQGIAAMTLGWRLRATLRVVSLVELGRRVPRCVKKYYQFPLYNLPYSLSGVFSKEFIVIALTAWGFAAYAGVYALARTMVLAPASFFSSTVGPVFYREAAVTIRSPRLQRLTLSIMTGLAALAPIVVFAAFWAPDLFAALFGEKWREAGSCARVLAAPAYLFLFSSWPERIFEVTHRQRVSFYIQVTADIIAIAAISLSLQQKASPLTAVTVMSAIQVCFHVSYLYAVFIVAEFDRTQYWALMMKILLASVASGACLAATSELVKPEAAQFLVGAVLTIGLAAFLGYRAYIAKSLEASLESDPI